MHSSSRRRALLCAAVASSIALSSVAAPQAAQAQKIQLEGPADFLDTLDNAEETSDAISSDPESAAELHVENFAGQAAVKASRPVAMPNGTTVQVKGDILGPWTEGIGMGATDLGVMAPLDDREYAMVFGDSFTGKAFGKGTWMSPTGVIAQTDSDGFVTVQRPMNSGSKVEKLISYYQEGNLTLIPSDIINIDGTLYMQAMWNNGIGNVSNTQIWKSTSRGREWTSIGYTGNSYMGGMGDLISWEEGDDGYIYAVSSSFKRADPVYLSRFKLEDIDDRTKWELYDPDTDNWTDEAAPILSKNVQAGEMNLRYIQGYWVLVMFNDATDAIEVRISDTLERDWNDVPVSTIAKAGSWSDKQSPTNWSQPYGGYIVPGSTIDNLDVVVSQWNTNTNKRYMSTQFNVRGLDTFYGIDSSKLPPLREVVPAKDEPTGRGNGGGGGASLSANMDEETERIVTIVGVLAGIAALAAMSFPYWRGALPPQLREFLHI